MLRLGVLLLTFLLTSTLLTGEANPESLDNARFLAIDGQYEEALTLFLELLEDEPDNVELNYYAGLCYFFLKDPGKSVFFLKVAVENGAEFPEAYYWLGQAYLSDWKLREALQAIDQGLKLFPRNEKLRHLSQHSRAASENKHRRRMDTDSDALLIPVQPPVSIEPVDDLR